MSLTDCIFLWNKSNTFLRPKVFLQNYHSPFVVWSKALKAAEFLNNNIPKTDNYQWLLDFATLDEIRLRHLVSCTKFLILYKEQGSTKQNIEWNLIFQRITSDTYKPSIFKCERWCPAIPK